ncbi:MAG: collagen-like protein [Patescibacteria group bacterium]
MTLKKMVLTSLVLVALAVTTSPAFGQDPPEPAPAGTSETYQPPAPAANELKLEELQVDNTAVAGPQGPAGSPGARGAQGPPGPSGSTEGINALLATCRRVKNPAYKSGYQMVTVWPASQVLAQAAADTDRLENLYPATPDYGFKLRDGLQPAAIEELEQAQAWAASKENQRQNNALVGLTKTNGATQKQVDGLAKGQESLAKETAFNTQALVETKARDDAQDKSIGKLESWAKRAMKRADRDGIAILAIVATIAFAMMVGLTVLLAAMPRVRNVVAGLAGLFTLLMGVAMVALVTMYFVVPAVI